MFIDELITPNFNRFLLRYSCSEHKVGMEQYFMNKPPIKEKSLFLKF